MNNPNPQGEAALFQMLQAMKVAESQGRVDEAGQLLTRAAQMAPNHPAVLNELGVRMLQRGEADKAEALLKRATQALPTEPALWSNYAQSLHVLERFDEEMEAVEKALALEPRHLPALLQKGALLEIRGDERNAARTYRNAFATIPPGAQLPPNVIEAVEHAREVVRRDEGDLYSAIGARLADVRSKHSAAELRRAERCVDLLVGRRKRFHSEPTFTLFPEIPEVDFFERSDFPWLASIEAATDSIRTELTSVLIGDRGGMRPYVQHQSGVPLDQWAELNHSRRWSAYFLWDQGAPQAAHMARCPKTVEALKGAPQCDVPGTAPTAFFSILDAKTRIPPHCGVTNTRVIVHLPLIVPPGCGFRVGSETREWAPGKAWVFDDSIEHEAWNDSDAPRAVLIFDVWNPFLSAAERDVVRLATETYALHYGTPAPGGG